MSTGDQSEYMRKKMAERRMGPFATEPKFMKSGFQMWAENERPARQGGAMKDAEEMMSTSRRGDILKQVKKVGEDMWSEFYKGSGKHIEGHCESSSDEESEEEDKMEGGRIGLEGRPKYVVKTSTGTGKPKKARKSKKDTGGKGRMSPEEWEAMGKKDTGKGMVEDAMDAVRRQTGVRDAALKAVKGKRKGTVEEAEDAVRRQSGVRDAAFQMVKGKGYSGNGKGGPIETTYYQTQDGGVGSTDLAPRPRGAKQITFREYLEARAGKASAPAPTTGSGKKVSARAAIVKKVMKEKGLSLPAASKYVKEHGLYKA